MPTSEEQVPTELDFNPLLVRAVAIPVEAVGGEGKPYWFHAQESFPFFITRTVNFTFNAEEGDEEELDHYEFDIIVRHVSGNRTEGIPGEAEQKLNEQMPKVIAAFLSRTLLQHEEDEDAPDWLESAYLTDVSGLKVADASGLGGSVNQIVCDYTIHCICRVDNLQEWE